jgi:hypothetical protein
LSEPRAWRSLASVLPIRSSWPRAKRCSAGMAISWNLIEELPELMTRMFSMHSIVEGRHE